MRSLPLRQEITNIIITCLNRYHRCLPSAVFGVSVTGFFFREYQTAQAFKLFNEWDASSKGTGVRLALVKRIVNVHGGEIWVESKELGFGSTFFTLTLKSDSE